MSIPQPQDKGLGWSRTKCNPQLLAKDLGLNKTWNILQLPEKGPSWSEAGSIPQPLDKDTG